MRTVNDNSKWRFNGFSAFVHSICGTYAGFAFPADDRGVGSRESQPMKYASNKGSGCRHQVIELCPAKSPVFASSGGFKYPPPAAPLSVAAPYFHIDDKSKFDIRIVNKLPNLGENPCLAYGGNSLKVFRPGAAEHAHESDIIVPGGERVFKDRFAQRAGLGIQINNWYWPFDSGKAKPELSGLNIRISSNCGHPDFDNVRRWSSSVRTDFVADVSIAKDRSGTCVVTISNNAWTDAVTPKCCKSCTPEPQGSGYKTASGKVWPVQK